MFSFIILHYKNIDETLECLTYLSKITNNDCHIVIVDNNSLTITEEQKLMSYTKDIIKLPENMGFAKANNIGITYAKEKFDSKYYIVMNNDVYIKDCKFLKKIDDDYKKYQFDMLGPSIDSPSGESVNPFPVIKDLDGVNKRIERAKKLIKIYGNPVTYFILENYIKLKHRVKQPTKPQNGSNVDTESPLHGCCIVFSKKYLNKYKNAFFNDTFLFHEEEFIYQRVLKDKLISLYDPTISVFHKEGSSIKKSNKSIRNSKIFKQKECIKSLELLKKYIQGEIQDE